MYVTLVTNSQTIVNKHLVTDYNRKSLNELCLQ